MKRLIEKTVFSGFVIAWRLASWTTSRSFPLAKATTDGVVRPPSGLVMTVGVPPSMTATTELVVPRSIPMILLISLRSSASLTRTSLWSFSQPQGYDVSVKKSSFAEAPETIQFAAAANQEYYTLTPPLGGQMQRGLALTSFLLATTLHAQDETYPYAYLSHVEGEVSLQRASEPEPESGSLNVPLPPGARIWTRAGSRAEIRFGSGLVVHLSEGAKLDFVATDSDTILM